MSNTFRIGSFPIPEFKSSERVTLLKGASWVSPYPSLGAPASAGRSSVFPTGSALPMIPWRSPHIAVALSTARDLFPLPPHRCSFAVQIGLARLGKFDHRLAALNRAVDAGAPGGMADRAEALLLPGVLAVRVFAINMPRSTATAYQRARPTGKVAIVRVSPQSVSNGKRVRKHIRAPAQLRYKCVPCIPFVWRVKTTTKSPWTVLSIMRLVLATIGTEYHRVAGTGQTTMTPGSCGSSPPRGAGRVFWWWCGHGGIPTAVSTGSTSFPCWRWAATRYLTAVTMITMVLTRRLRSRGRSRHGKSSLWSSPQPDRPRGRPPFAPH